MAVTRSFPTQHPSGLPVTDTRRVLAGLLVRNADGTPRAGVIPTHTGPLVTGRASMGYDIAPFVAATARVNTGVELVANDAVTTVPTTAAPAANSRIDVIWVRSQFAQHGDASNDPVFGVTQGNPAPSPVKPQIPAGALELATAEILSSSTTTASVVITQTAEFTTTAQSPVSFRNKAQLDQWRGASRSQQAVALDTGLLFSYDGSSWIPAGAYPWERLTAASGWTANSGTVAPEVSRDGGTAHSRGGFFGGSPNSTATVLPEWARPSRTIRVPIVLGDTNFTVGSVRIWTDGAFQPSGNLGPQSSASWPVI